MGRQFLTNLLVGMGRYRRGGALSARRFIKGGAVTHLLTLLNRHVPVFVQVLGSSMLFNCLKRPNSMLPRMYTLDQLGGLLIDREATLQVRVAGESLWRERTCMKLDYEQLKRISNSVGERMGWDFTRVRDGRDPVPWHYPDMVRRFLNDTDEVLDVGTGGGEKFLTLAPYFRKGIGIDVNPAMVEHARRNQAAQGITNVEWAVMDGCRLPFPEARFDVVLNRQANVDVPETVRVLQPDGYFVTQQVARRNTLNVLQAFGWTPESFGEGWWQPVGSFAAEFERLGCRVVAQAEYDVRYWFCDVESLVFWLKAVLLPEPFDMEKHWRGVKRIVETHSTQRGIETNEHRELLIVQKE